MDQSTGCVPNRSGDQVNIDYVVHQLQRFSDSVQNSHRKHQRFFTPDVVKHIGACVMRYADQLTESLRLQGIIDGDITAFEYFKRVVEKAHGLGYFDGKLFHTTPQALRQKDDLLRFIERPQEGY